MNGYSVIHEINHPKHGSAILVRNDTVPSSVKVTVHAETELIAATFENVTAPSCRALSTAGDGSEATTLTSPACHRAYATYVTGECTTTYLAHNTSLTPRLPLRSSLYAADTTTKSPTAKLSPLPLTMALPLSLRHRGRHTIPSVT